jgi:leader peptidase (prepilin peptidase)/N-methyltransferase
LFEFNFWQHPPLLITFPPMIPVGAKLFFDVIVFLFGAAIGSFLNVCIYRMPAGKSIVKPASHCGSCKTPIAWYDNLPLVSWFLLGGKCRHCGARFSFRYWVVELLTGALFLAVWLQFGPDAWTLADEEGLMPASQLLPPLIVPIYWLLLGGLIAATFIDLDHYIIPDEISIGGVVVGFALSCAVPSLHGAENFLMGGLASALGIMVGSAVVLWLAIFGEVIFKKEAMGFGDVKFMGMIGAFLGWQATLFSLFAASLVGAIVGVMWIAMSRERRAMGKKFSSEQAYYSLDAWDLRGEVDAASARSSIPFGPFLALGAVIWVFAGAHILKFCRAWLAVEP